MKINIELKNKNSDLISEVLGLKEEELSTFITNVAFNENHGVLGSIMEESETENFGQILLALSAMYINSQIRSFTKNLIKLSETLREEEE